MSDLFNIELPVVLGPMAGGPSTPALAAAVSNAGGLGSLGEGYESPDRIRDHIGTTRALTSRPFAVNLFVPDAVDRTDARIDAMLRALAPYREELGLDPQAIPDRFAEDFEAQLAVVVEERVPIFTFTFGLLPPGAIETLHDAGTIIGGTATTPAEAEALAAAGVDFVVAQGSEAGGHRGSFLPTPGDDLIGLAALGATAAQLGTAFLLCPEAGTSAPYREAVRTARPEDTVITSAFSGRRARGIANRFSRAFATRSDVPPYPVMNALTRELRKVAAERGDASLLSLWAGQSVGLVRELPAGELVAHLAYELRTMRREHGQPPVP